MEEKSTDWNKFMEFHKKECEKMKQSPIITVINKNGVFNIRSKTGEIVSFK